MSRVNDIASLAHTRAPAGLPAPHCTCFAGDVGDPFDADHRMGLKGTLHRISAIKDTNQPCSTIGLIYRIGRHISGLLAYFLVLWDPISAACAEYEKIGHGSTLRLSGLLLCLHACNANILDLVLLPRTYSWMLLR